MELENIEKENFDRSLAMHQIRQYLPLSINCAIRYVVCLVFLSYVFSRDVFLMEAQLKIINDIRNFDEFDQSYVPVTICAIWQLLCIS